MSILKIGYTLARKFFDWIDFDTTATVPHQEARLHWDDTEGTLNLGLKGGNVNMSIGTEMYLPYQAYNNSGVAIANGKAVYIDKANINKFELKLASSTSYEQASTTIAVSTEDVADKAHGWFTTFGLVHDCNTQAFNDGDILYLSTVAGEIVNVKPAVNPVIIGKCLVKHPTAGIIFVDIQNIIPKWGDVTGGNYSEFEADGTYKANGLATTYRDELNDLTARNFESPASAIVRNNAESSLTFKTTARLVDYATMNVQINHDWLMGSTVHPHLHWWALSANTPNWIIEYRWQMNEQAKTTAWTRAKWSSNAFPAGIKNQITTFPAITPPIGYRISDILQIRLIRDYINQSTLFAGNDPQTTDVDATSFDVHIQCDTLGSREEYIK